MASVMQGDAYNIPVTIKSGNGTLITPEIAACVEITVGQFTKRWPGQVTFDEKTGEWQFPVTQKQTFRFAPGAAVVQARVVFQAGSIMGGSGAPICVEQSASRGTLPQPEKVEAATGSAPKATEVTIPTVHDIDVSLHSQVILSDPIKAPYIGDNGNWYEYDAATGTFVDTGTPASGTPPITPDTAGKYLTNDGSKAKWGARVVENIRSFDTNEILHVASSGVTAIVQKKGNANSGDMVFPVIVQTDGTISHGSGFMSYLDAHGDRYYGGFSLAGGTVGVPKLTFSNTILYVTITQDGEDSSGNPIYKSDKTYEEIKAAHDAGREVKIARAGVFDNEIFLTLGLYDFPLLALDNDAAGFLALGIPLPFMPSSATGGQPISYVQIGIYKSGQVRIDVDFDPKTYEWSPNAINKLPQQYVINVIAGTDGTLTANWTFESCQAVARNYRTENGGTVVFGAFYEGRLHRMAAGDDKSVVFSDTTPEGISTLTLSQKDGKDVWTHEVVPLGGDNSFMVTLTSNDGGGYDKDKTFAEIKEAAEAGKVVFAVNSSLYERLIYLLTDIVEVGTSETKRLAFTGEYSTLVFYSDKGSEPTYNKGMSNHGSLVRGNSSYPTSMIKGNGRQFEPAKPNVDYMPPVPVTAADNGKFLRVVDGQWAADSVANAKGVSF